MRKAFTLIELLVVIGIMGLLGTTAVGGYHAMQRGMEERGVMENVNYFIRAAYHRAQIDRQPTAVCFWNETLRESGDYSSVIVVGKAVAIRRAGRFTDVDALDLYDEFADFEHTYTKDSGGAGNEADTMYVYPIDNLSASSLQRSIVYNRVFRREITLHHPTGVQGRLQDADMPAVDDVDVGNLFSFVLRIKEKGDVDWKRGMAYGFEFAELTLPQGYVFGSGDGVYSEDMTNPIRTQGTLAFSVGTSAGSISVSALRPGKTGALSATSIGRSENPAEKLK